MMARRQLLARKNQFFKLNFVRVILPAKQKVKNKVIKNKHKKIMFFKSFYYCIFKRKQLRPIYGSVTKNEHHN